MCSFLTGCVNAVDSASTEEVRVINENLQFKDKIVELENNLDERNQKGILEREIERIILDFFWILVMDILMKLKVKRLTISK